MRRTVISNEFAKMRHLHSWLLAALLLVVVTAVTVLGGVGNPYFDRATADSWNSLLSTFGGAVPLAAPLLLAIMASRQVDVEHVGGGWLLSATSGVTPGSLCRAKFLALAALVTGATVGSSALVTGTGLLLGVTAPWPAGRWLACTAAVLVVNLVLVALHVMVSARVENQLVGLGVGLLGTILALVASSLPGWLAHLVPWGYYGVAAGAEYVGSELVAATPSLLSIAGLAVVTGLAFGILTHRFDRQEA
ncbi:ABC transporter permease [Microlunatus sp. Y2014]|uniref:ABC transporter permease n=1 Tax=Microlunatus sp. Y2014 TaxID=3418488 RepID=UPI003DA702E8